jgi:hypothetical protein
VTFTNCAALGTITGGIYANVGNGGITAGTFQTPAGGLIANNSGVTAPLFKATGGGGYGAVQLSNGSNSGIGAVDPNSVNYRLLYMDIYGDIQVGDANNGLSAVIATKTAGNIYHQFGGADCRVIGPGLGTVNTQLQTYAHQQFPAWLTTTNAATGFLTICQPPTNHHGTRIRVEWSCRDTATDHMASGMVTATLRNVSGTTAIVGGNAVIVPATGDTDLASCAVTIVASPGYGGSAQVIPAPPSGYSGTLDWTFYVYLHGV